MIDIIGKKWWYFIISAVILIPGMISLFLWGLKPSIDFTGGTLIEIYADPKIITEDNFKEIVQSAGMDVYSFQKLGEGDYLIRLKPVDSSANEKLLNTLKEKNASPIEKRFETVGPTIGSETTFNALKSVAFASLAIILYIAFAFRGIPKPYSSWKFGVCAVLALLHDVLVVIGAFSILGHFMKVEVDSLFITALLTIMGFSVHDTIVVFDRIRENIIKKPSMVFADVVNLSVLQTLVRSLSTSLTVIFTLVSMIIFGGESIRWFLVALLIGIISGTYSSIFNASPLLVVWEEFGKQRSKKNKS